MSRTQLQHMITQSEHMQTAQYYPGININAYSLNLFYFFLIIFISCSQKDYQS